MELDIREMMANAQRQSDEFMRQSREQARIQLEAQRMTVAQTTVGGAGSGGFPGAGTPAGRMLDTITQLVQRGVSTGGGVVAGAYGAGMGQVGALGGMAGGLAAAPIDLGGAMFTAQQRNMRFMQTFATAAGLGFARQRMDMTSTQAAEMAQEELSSRMTRGWRRGLTGTLNAATFGTYGYLRRAAGREQEWEGREDIAAGLQQQMRYVRRSALDRAGMEDFAGPFPTGITREGAREMARQMSQDVYAPLQQQYGLTGKELTTVQARAMGTMGRQGVEDLLGSGRAVRSGHLGRQMRGVIEVQQALNISAEEADQFWNMVGQMHGTAERIAQKTRQVRRTAGALGLGTREAMQGIMEFERTGIQTGMGADRARAVAENYTQSLYETYRRGGLSGEQMMRYGGNTPEEGLRRQMQARFQENMGMWAGGAGMMGVGVLAGDRKAWGQMTGGKLSFMGAMGEVGRAYTRDPFAGQRARFDPTVHQTIGASADRAMYQLARKMPAVGAGAQQRIQRVAQFQAMTGLSDLDASSRFSQFESEEAVATSMLGVAVTEEKPGAAGEVASIYSELVGSGMAAVAAQSVGEGSVWEAAKKLWEQGGRAGGSAVDMLRKSAVPKALDVSKAKGDISTLVMSQMGEALSINTRAVDATSAVEKITRGFVKQTKDAGRAMNAAALTRAFLGNEAGMLLTSKDKDSADQAQVALDASGNLVLASTNIPELQGFLGERVSKLSKVRAWQKLTPHIGPGTDNRVRAEYGGASLTVLSSLGLATGAPDLQARLMEALAAAPGVGQVAMEKVMYQGVAGLAGALKAVSSSGSDTPMMDFMGRVANMENSAEMMSLASQYGLSGLQTFANLFKKTAGGFEVQETDVGRFQASMKAFGAEKLASVLGMSVEDTQGLLKGAEGAQNLMTRMQDSGVAQTLLASIFDSIDKSKFNALGSSAANALWVQIKGKDDVTSVNDANMKPGG